MTRPPKACNTPGCPGFVGRPDGHTPDCRARRRRRDHRPSAGQRGYGARWRQLRALKLKRQPDCEWCGEQATDVDHIDGQGPLGPRGCDWSNLRSLCHSCHSKRTARDQPGGWNAR